MALEPDDTLRISSEVTSDAHHSLAIHEVVLLLETHAHDGLSESEARRRLVQFGPNRLPEAKAGGPFLRFLHQLHHPLIYVLLVAGFVTLLLGEGVESGVIFGVVLVNALVGFVQESKAEAALDALRSMVQTDARVRRDGSQRPIPSVDLVPGDVVLIKAGDKVPADLRLLEITELQVDESALTGESVPVVKDDVVLPDATVVADRRNMVYSGALITNGTGVGVVVATGVETELGEIHRLVGSAANLATPLTRKLTWFSKVLTVAILALAAVTFGVGMLRGESATEMFTASVALAVGAIPEGLPAAVTITLAIGVNRMARRRAVIRRMPAVETLGSTTVVCSDKTGTLTENQMTVRAVWAHGELFDVTGTGYQPEGAVLGRSGDAADLGASEALRWTLIAGAVCNDARLTQADDGWEVLGDPTEGAMLVAAAKAGLDRQHLAGAFPRVDAIPFSSERKYMATLHRDEHDGYVVLVKGAVERVLDMCSTRIAADGALAALDGVAVLAAAESLARDGLRVLATATTQVKEPTEFDVESLRGSLTLTGLQAMLDPPRQAAIDAVAHCHTAGIDVKMITGDHASTATAIADQLGISADRHDGDVLTGGDLAKLSADEYPDAVERASVFARVSPEQKLRLVEGLQARDHVVAMTGDGVNDAPALQQSDIGVAMGRGGTEVAKEAADMVLTDDNFATIEAAIEEGRGVFDNLTKFIVWTLPTNMGEGFVILVAIILGTALPILPVQILWINMTTAIALGLMLAFEPKEAGIMERPPRDPRTPLLTGALILRILLVSALLVGGAWWLFEWERSSGATLAEARTAALNLFVVVEAFYLFNCRSLTHSVWQVGVFSNRWILAGVTAQALGQLAITYVPAMNTVFQTAPITPQAWLRILAIAAAATIVVAIDKRLRRQLA
ncbi:MAG: cation-transporting P-type ATPase [Acidimicrobiia bacterium]